MKPEFYQVAGDTPASVEAKRGTREQRGHAIFYE